MSRLTKQYAKILADMLSDDAREVIRIYRDRKHGTISQEGLDEVISHELIEETVNLLDNKKVWILTPNGKKVAEFVI